MKIHHTKTKGDLGVLKSQNEKTLSLRVKAPRNNQTANVKFADDYREVP